MQELVEQLRTELANARQETSIASEALTASTELAGRLQAHVGIAQEQGAAVVQRVTHEHSRATAELEHRLQQATAALQRSTASAAAADAQQGESIQALQQRLEAALAQSKTAASKNEELASTVVQLEAQLDLAQSSMTIQSAASEGAAAQMQAQVDALRLQLTAANQAAAGAAAEGGIADHQAAAQHKEDVCDLHETLETTEAVLQCMTANDAATEEDRRQVVHALQQQLAEAAEQVLVAQGQVFDSTNTIAALELQLVVAQNALLQRAHSSKSAVQELQSQVECPAIIIDTIHHPVLCFKFSILASCIIQYMIDSAVAFRRMATNQCSVDLLSDWVHPRATGGHFATAACRRRASCSHISCQCSIPVAEVHSCRGVLPAV